MILTIPSYSQGYNAKSSTHKGYNTPYTRYRSANWSGSGIAIGKKIIATNNHVVAGATNLSVYFPEAKEEYGATVLSVDRDNDIAIVEISDKDFDGFGEIKYGFKKDVEEIGVDVFVLGYPLIQTMGTEVKLTTGVVSSKSGYQGNRSQYQISAPVQPGNSGGPLFNDKGELIGIVSAKHSDAENVSYGVKFSYLYDLAKGIPNLDLDGKSQIANLSLSEQCQSIIPFTVMILANNKPITEVPTEISSHYQSPATESYSFIRSYPVRINCPKIGYQENTYIRIDGIELTEKYTAVYLSYNNDIYQENWYSVDKGIYVSDTKTKKKYALITTENCAIAPDKTPAVYGQTHDFTLYLEPIPVETEYIDIFEPGESNWKFYDIELY